MKVSVIIPNHGRDLSLILESLMQSNVLPDEIFVVDEGFERSKQRNMGIDRAIKRFGKEDHALLILDSDQAISPTLIGECKNLIEAGYSCVYIPEIFVVKSFFGKVRKFEREFYTGTAVDVPRFVRADMCPMFDESMSGPEDADWGNRIQGKRAISISPFYHHDDIPIWEYFKKKAYYARSMGIYKQRNPDDKVLSMKYRCWTVFVENGKWKKILKHPLLFLCIYFIIFIRGIGYVTTKKH